MGVRIEPHAEPIPGYRLIERLGGGGFGEVWKAEAPGGLFKAIKFVYGELDDPASATGNEDSSRADQEFKALNRVKTVQHPYILNLERIEKIEGQLVIVMELAHRTLWDRFRECRSQGLPGIPREELLSYLEETAEALDLMNIQYQLQHLDIKPQNLFLVHNHIKVADFGLVKDLEGMAATVTGGVTPVYAAPETFDGWLSRFSDQYSLAIVYQELLTGTRPFSGTTMRQLVLQHLQGSPDLNSLPGVDRPVIAKALAKNPEERYPTCEAMVKGLRSAKQQAEQLAKAPGANPVPDSPASELATTRDGLKAAKPSPIGGGPSDAATPSPLGTPQSGIPGLASPQVLPPRPGKAPPPKPPASKPKSLLDSQPKAKLEVPSLSPKTFFNRPRPKTQNEYAGPDNDKEKGILQPALIIGVGRLGVDTLRHVRQQLFHEFGAADALPQIRLLALDTDAEALQQAQNQGDETTLLKNSETLHVKLNRPSHYLRGKENPYETWLNSRLLYRIPKHLNQAGVRALGRLALVDNFRSVYRRLEMEIQSCCSDDTRHQMAARHSELGLRSHTPRVYVVTSLFGATGSGMFIDLAYILRQVLRKQGFGGAEVHGILYLPPTDKSQSAIPLAQSVASLIELKHFSVGESVYQARYPGEGNHMVTFNEAGPPLSRAYLLNLPTSSAGPRSQVLDGGETTRLGGQFLCRELTTNLGKALDGVRRKKAGLGSLGTTFSTFGMYRVVWPRYQILETTARSLCKRLLDRWMSKDGSTVRQQLQPWAHEQWEAQGYRVETLITGFQEQAEQRLKQTPDSTFTNLVNPLVKHLSPKPDHQPGQPVTLNLTPVVGVMSQFEKLLGIPEESRVPSAHYEMGAIERALAETCDSMSSRGEEVFATLVVRLLEDPHYRLAGAEEALRQFSNIVEQSLQNHETLMRELSERANKFYLRIQKIIEAPAQTTTPSNSVWKGPFARKAPPSTPHLGLELLELLRAYPKCLYQSLVLAQITRLYVSLRGVLSDQIREVGFCRHRLTELGGFLERRTPGQAAGDPVMSDKPPSFEKRLLPIGCTDIRECLTAVQESINANDLIAFDKVVQSLVQQHYKALLNVCLGASSVVRNLAPMMLHSAEQFLEPRLARESVAEMFLGAHGGERSENLEDELSNCHDEAIPDLTGKASAQELAYIVTPGDEAGHTIQEQLVKAVPEAELLAASRNDEIIFYREQTNLQLADLEQFKPEMQELYRQRLAADPQSLHTREDIAEWQQPAEAQR